MNEDADPTLPLDTKVQRILVDNHRAFLAFLERRVGSRDVAEDILQDAFARGLQKADTIRAPEAIVPWFYRLLRNAAIDHFRRAKSRNKALAEFTQEVEAQETPDAELQTEVCRCVARLAETLKEEYADALKGIELQGLSVAEFAEARGISKGNAGVRVFRARQALRRQVERSCGTCAEHGCFDCTCPPRPSGGCH